MSSSHRNLRDEGTRFDSILAGAFSGLTARCLTAPFDVIKINLQIRPRSIQGSSSRAGLSWTVREIYSSSGLWGFWRGNVSASWLYVVYNTVQFSMYKLVSPNFDALGLPFVLSSTISGALAGSVATATAYPFDLIRTRFAAEGSNKVYTSFRSSIGKIYAVEGVKGFYKGLTIAVSQGAPYMGLLFGVYEVSHPFISKLGLPVRSDDAVAGAFAGIVAKSGTYPLDLIRKRVQMQGPSRIVFLDGSIPEYRSGFWRVGKTIIQREGWRGLYRGLSMGLLKATPTSIISMWSYGFAIGTLEKIKV